MADTTLFLELPGAVADERHGAPLHYGAPLAEQRDLEKGDAVVDLGHRGVVTVSGPDRLTWLHSLTSQQLTGLQPGESVETMLLGPNGRIEHAIRFVDDGECSWLLVDEGEAEGLAAFLDRMRFMLRVEVRDVSAEYCAVAVFEGGSALPALRGLGTAVVEWIDPWNRVLPGGVQYAGGDRPADWPAVQLVFPRTELATVLELVRSGEVRPAGLLSLDALEVRAWRPSQHGEVDDRAIPHETDWLRTAVHLTKGCYRGQETVAKVHNLGHPPRRLAMLHLDGSGGELPVAGALVYLPGEAAKEGSRPVGRLTRVALHHEWGGIALALLKRSVPEESGLEVRAGVTGADPAAVDGEVVACAQEVIVPASAGATRKRDDVRRLPPRRP